MQAHNSSTKGTKSVCLLDWSTMSWTK